MTTAPGGRHAARAGLLGGARTLTRATLGVPLLVAREAVSLPRSAVRSVIPAGGDPVDRQVWAAAGHAGVEVRGLDADGVDREAAAAAVQRSVAGAPGITWARIDAATARIAVRYDRRVHTVAGLVELLADAEERVRTGSDDGRDVPAPEPSPRAAQDAALLTADAVALVATIGARLAGVPRLPTSLGAAVALAEHQPYLRARIERALGPGRTELVLGLLNASVRAVTRDVPALLLDGGARSVTLHAEQVRRRAVAERAAELSGPGRPAPRPPGKQDGRPVPLPPGSVDRLAARMGRASLLAAAGLLAGTGNPDLAGRTLLVGIPRAAHAARDAFAAGLSTGLADRGVVVTDPDVLRRLDRVTTVVVQSGVLHTVRPLVVDVRADAEGWTTARVWRAAQRLLDAGDGTTAPLSPRRALLAAGPGDPPGEGGVSASRRVLTEDGRAVGEVLVGRELDPHTDAVLSAVREAALRLVLTEDVTAADLAGRADEVLRNGHGDPAWLREQVRRMQAEGAVVAVVGFDQEALDAADVGIGVVPADGPVPWAADLLCGPGLLEVPRLVGAVPVARDVSARGVRASLGASFLGGLLMAVGRPGTGGGAQLPVTLAALGELVSGLRAGRGAVRRPDPVAVLHTPWHALEPEEVLGRLPDPGPVEAAAENPDAPAPEPLRARSLALAGALVSNVRAELADPLTPVLATGAGASAVIGSPTDALLVGGVLLGSAVISGVQRMRAERALRELLRDQRLPARVVSGDGDDRGAGGSGQPRRVPAAALRPGHLIDLRSGDVVPADARLLTVDELEADEATLTGESTPVGKDPTSTPGADLPDRTCMVYEGTTVVAGSGRAVVVATGEATEAGRALALAARAAAPAGLQARLEELTSRGLPVTLFGGAAVTALALLRGAPLRTAISGGVSAAVAAVPEGLPLMATVAQLSAARRLSRRGVLVRSSRTVEALGRVDTICFDKTGTLTEGRQRLVRTAGLDGPWDSDGAAARRLLRGAAHAGPSPHGQHRLAHATDQAVLDAARALLGADLEDEWQELVEIPFHSERGFSAALGRTPATVRLVVKGAPEVLLPRCSFVRDEVGKHPLDRAGRERASAAVRSLAAQGLRVLAVARRNVGDGADSIPDPDDVADLGDLTLLGFLGLADAPRPEAAATVAALQDAGIATVMITGDHPVTAAAIARQLGIPAEEPVTGPELAALEEPARIARVGRASVFARVSPEQKLQIIEALRHGGRIVAMAGDGANDAAAIRIADVGIGMAARGSTSARSAADLVFTEPDVSLVLDALVEGRAMWWRVRDAVAVLVGGNVGEVAFTLMGTALAGRAPISTRQFLLVNMFTDLLPSMAIALAPTPADPQDRRALLAGGQPSMGRELLRDIGARGAATSAGALLAWQIGRIGPFRRRASTIALAALVGAELGQTLLLAHRDPLVLTTALGSAAALAAVIQTPGVSQFFGCTPLDPVAWAVVLACSAAATAASAAWPARAPALRGPERDTQG